jgi:chloramphenicol 3-O-phosphotransferase
MATGKLIVVTGPAAVGKSTVTKALQKELTRANELWLAIELDVFARSLPRPWIAWGDYRGRNAAQGFVYARRPDGSLQLELGADGRRVLAAFHRSVAAVVGSGVSAICETVVYDEVDWDDWSAALKGIRPCWVRLTAPSSVLEARESERAEMARGLGRGMAARPSVGNYDVEADTSTEATESIVARIVESVRSR